MKKVLSTLVLIFLLFTLASCSERESAPENKDVVVEFVTDGTSVKTVVNKTIEEMPLTEKEGYVLEGWYEDAELKTRVSFPFRALASCKLYVKWIDKSKGNEEIVYKRNDDGSYSVEKCYTLCPTIWIPDRTEDGPVKELLSGFLRYKTAVKVIHIGKNVQIIEENFSRCLSLAEFDVDEKNADWLDEDGILYSKDKTLLYDYPTAKEGASFSVPESVTSLGEGAFSFNLFIGALTVGSQLEATFDCFKNMNNLARIDVEENNPSFCSEEGVLYSADGKTLLLYPVKYPSKTYTIKPGTTEVIEGAFSDSEIEVLNINKDLSVFYAPENVPFLTTYTVENGNAYFVSRDGVLFIDEGSTLYLVPQGKTGEYTVFPGTKIIYDFSFGESRLSKVIVPSSVTKIGRYAFRNCEYLENLTFEENSLIEEIEESAFSRCTALKRVVLTGRVPPETGADLFISCPGSLVIVIPAYTDGLYAAKWNFCSEYLSATGQAVTLYDVIFDACGGTSVPAVRGAYVLSEPSTVRTSPSEKEYYILLGWYDNPEGTGQRITFPYAVTEDVTLYAAWDLGLRDVDE